MLWGTMILFPFWQSFGRRSKTRGSSRRLRISLSKIQIQRRLVYRLKEIKSNLPTISEDRIAEKDFKS